jgi:alpha-beta hydrolase superfamily lysophospholipase
VVIMIENNLLVPSNYDHLNLDVLSVEPENGAKGIVQISHGMSEYKERYLPLMRFLASYGYACIIHDHRGHGKSVRSPRDLGYFYQGQAEALVEDLYQVTCLAKEEWPGLPVILLGHSMGSLIARNYLKKYDDELRMLILTGPPSKNPAAELGIGIASLEGRLLGYRHKSTLLAALSFGGYIRKFPGEKSRFAWTCSDPRVVEEYDRSPYCGFTFSDDGYLGLLKLMRETYNRKNWKCYQPGLPVLFLGGTEDPCIGGKRKFYQEIRHLKSVGYRNITQKLYPGMRHEILNERGKDIVFYNILTYIEKNLKICYTFNHVRKTK